MKDFQAREDATQAEPDAWLEVRPDALAWIAGNRPEWWGTSNGEPAVKILKICEDTGFDDNVLYRIQAAARDRSRVSLKTDMLARVVRLGATERGVTDATAFARIFAVIERQAASAPVGAAA